MMNYENREQAYADGHNTERQWTDVRNEPDSSLKTGRMPIQKLTASDFWNIRKETPHKRTDDIEAEKCLSKDTLIRTINDISREIDGIEEEIRKAEADLDRNRKDTEYLLSRPRKHLDPRLVKIHEIVSERIPGTADLTEEELFHLLVHVFSDQSTKTMADTLVCDFMKRMPPDEWKPIFSII